MAQRTNSYSSGIEAVGGVNVVRALLAGLVATGAITALMYGGPAMGFPRMDIATMLGTMFVADLAAAFIPGLAMHVMIGLVLAFGYAFVFVRLLPGAPWSYVGRSTAWYRG